MKRKRFWWLTGPVFVIILVIPVFQTRTRNYCPRCHSTEVARQWRIGLWRGPSLPFSPQTEDIRPSHILLEQMDGHCSHEWKFMQESPLLLFGSIWGGCALGRHPDANSLVHAYEQQPSFRSLIRSRQQQGAFTRSQFVSALQLSNDPADIAGFSPREQELADWSNRLLTEFAAPQ